MSNYILIANNTCDLPEELLKDLDLTILPLGFTIGDDSYKTMPPKEFYQKIREGAMPSTNAANVGEYVDLFEPVLEAGKDVLCLVFSSGLSATYNAAVIAAEEMAEKYPDRKILLVDSLSASLGEGLLVHGAAKKRLAGESIEAVHKWLEDTKLKVAHWFTVNDLGHLKRGGRISGAQAVIGGMLGVKPILRVSDEGRLVPAGKVRGRAAALAELVGRLEKSGVDFTDETIYISHADCADEANALAEEIRGKFGPKEVIVDFIGPVIGSHTGIGVIALFFQTADRN